MILSELIFDIDHPMALRCFRDPYHTHAAIMRGFGPTEVGRVLFRVEPLRDPGVREAVVLVQSPVLPSWKPLEAELGAAFRWDTRRLEVDLAAGQTVFFRLRANPAVKRDGTRIPLIGEEALLAWLLRKGEARGFGFDPKQVLVREEGRWSHRTRREASPGTIVIQTVLFEGHLQVREATLFRGALEQGIGPAKGFGCGLLSVRGHGI